MKNKKRKVQNYVNNADFYDALVVYRAQCDKVREDYKINCERLIKEHAEDRINEPLELPKLELPRVPPYVGECIFLIANKLANASNFCNYSYRDEMISDGLEDCILRIHSFDPAKSKNPFAYFTQTCYFASVRRIKKEKKQKTIKSEMIRNSNALEYFQNGSAQGGDDAQHESSYLAFLLENLDVVATDAEKEQAAKKVFKKTTKAHQAKLKEREEAAKTMYDVVDESPDDLVSDVEQDIQDYYQKIEE